METTNVSSANGEALSAPDLNAVHTQSGGLHSLLAVLYEASNDLDFAPDGPAFDAACRLSNLLILARDEAERLDAAIGNCIVGGCHRTPAPSIAAPIIVDPTIIDPAKLSVDQMFGLFTALGTIFDVMSGLLCQPRFQGAESVLNPAGDVLDRLQEVIGEARDAIRQEVLARKVTGRGDVSRQFFFAAEKWIDGSCEPNAAVKGLATALKGLGKAVRS